MNELLIIIFSCIIGYSIGSFPTAYLVSKIKGVDVFTVGSRQAGATNVWKRVSKIGGINVFIIDVTKNIIGINNTAYKATMSTPNTFSNIKNCTEKIIYLANPNNRTFNRLTKIIRLCDKDCFSIFE